MAADAPGHAEDTLNSAAKGDLRTTNQGWFRLARRRNGEAELDKLLAESASIPSPREAVADGSAV